VPEVLERPQTITIAEAARRLGVCESSAYEAARRGEIPTIRLGRRLLVPRAAFDALLGARCNA
jgi:excisionase family DNA binding protein